MKILHLDFNQQNSVVPWIGLALTVLGIVAVLWVMTQIDVAKEQKNQLELREDEISLRLKQREAKATVERNASPVSTKVEKIRRDQMLTNETAFQILEQVWEQQIAFTRLEIATVERDIKIDLEAKTLNDVLLLVDRLEALDEVKQVSLARNSVKIGDPHLPAVAAMEIFWHPTASAPTNLATRTASEAKASEPVSATASAVIASKPAARPKTQGASK
ncbi:MULTISPECIES: hypothetical protein [Deefgea]|uniref:Fimbrial assembly protein n=1 Tax=Deefgea chitinilytica TaxID=570276 RepID=A0ABS2CFX2_9NEIS|nr:MULTISPECIES: hypothetical protein [Deefgea]MBM5572286.1 hypothetical protein [Deefgea chitinilytica]MBM9889522.1 hypothetical protein [Deefgea sp. CFH1-16]